MTTFLSTYLNKVDKKGRVSVPAAYRNALSGSSYHGILAYPSLTEPAIEAFGRDMLEEMNRKRLSQSLDGGDFERTLLGGMGDTVETIMALVSELPFDGDGRIVLPAALIGHAGISDQATFVGRGSRFQIWAPDAFAERRAREVAALRTRIGEEGGA